MLPSSSQTILEKKAEDVSDPSLGDSHRGWDSRATRNGRMRGSPGEKVLKMAKAERN